jgi:hypothetical protein
VDLERYANRLSITHGAAFGCEAERGTGEVNRLDGFEATGIAWLVYERLTSYD